MLGARPGEGLDRVRAGRCVYWSAGYCDRPTWALGAYCCEAHTRRLWGDEPYQRTLAVAWEYSNPSIGSHRLQQWPRNLRAPPEAIMGRQ